jgi:hypothetical protein
LVKIHFAEGHLVDTSKRVLPFLLVLNPDKIEELTENLIAAASKRPDIEPEIPVDNTVVLSERDRKMVEQAKKESEKFKASFSEPIEGGEIEDIE